MKRSTIRTTRPSHRAARYVARRKATPIGAMGNLRRFLHWIGREIRLDLAAAALLGMGLIPLVAVLGYGLAFYCVAELIVPPGRVVEKLGFSLFAWLCWGPGLNRAWVFFKAQCRAMGELPLGS